MGTISIFNLDFSGTPFACSRDFTGAYRLQVGDFVVALTPDAADALAQGGARIRLKARIASRFAREMRAGAAYKRDLRAVDGRTVHVEIGVSDSGDSIFLEIGTTRMTLTDVQAQLLLAVLDQLAAWLSLAGRRLDRRTSPLFRDCAVGYSRGRSTRHGDAHAVPPPDHYHNHGERPADHGR
jgi:hypothetical protein